MSTTVDRMTSGLATAPRPAREAWMTAGPALVLMLAAWFVLFWDAIAGAVRVWIGSATFNHCFLIPPIIAYLLWERRAVFAAILPRPSLAALWLLPGLGLVWIVARTASVLEGQQFAAIAILEVLFLVILGWRLYRALLFPLLYLVMMVPTAEFLVPPLQDLTGAFAVFGLELSGIPVFIDGIFIQIPTGDFRIAEACAGLRFLIASVAFGFLFQALFYQAWWKRVVFVVLSAVVPIIANGFRAYGIILIAYLSNNELAVGVDHIVYGWGFFAAVTLALTWAGLRFRDPPIDWAGVTAAIDSGPLPAASRRQVALAAGLAIVAMGLGPALFTYLQVRPGSDRLAALVPPVVSGGWQLSADPTRWSPILPGADRATAARFTKGNQAIDFHIAYYVRQRKGAEIISFANHMADDEIWLRVGSGAAQATVDGKPVQVATTRMSSGRTHRLVWHWYWVGGTFASRTLETKLLQVQGELFQGRRAAAVIAISSEYVGDPESAAAELSDFLAHSQSLSDLLAQVSGETR